MDGAGHRPTARNTVDGAAADATIEIGGGALTHDQRDAHAISDSPLTPIVSPDLGLQPPEKERFKAGELLWVYSPLGRKGTRQVS